MSKIINLGRARKDRARATKRARGDANAAKFGQTKAEKSLAVARAEKAGRDLEGHRLDRDERLADSGEGPGEDGPG